MNPWDNEAPWINTLRIPKAAKEALWRQMQNGSVTEQEAQSYDWGLFTDIADFVRTTLNSRVLGVPPNELQKAYTDLETIRTRIATTDKEIDAFNKALTASRTANVKVGKRTYSRDRATELLDNLGENRKMLDDSLTDLMVRIKITREDITAQKEYADGFWQRYQQTKDPEDFKKWQNASKGIQTQVVSAVNEPGPTVRMGVGTVARRGPTAAQATEMERQRTEAFAGRVPGAATRPPVPGVAGAGATRVGATAPVAVTRTDVATEITSRGLPDTPENRRRVREELKAGKKRTSDWEALVREQAGEYAYLLDPKYEGVPDLLRKAVQQEWFKTEEGQKQFLQEFKKTPYALNADANQERFDLSDAGTKRDLVGAQIRKIQTEYGAVQLDGATLEEVATTAARNQADNIELGRLVYRAAFKRGAAAPDYTAPVAARTALGGADADRIRAIYRAYGQKADDQTIARILAAETDPASGVVMTEDMLRNNLRDIAKVSYKSFADLLDRGISIETIFQPYQQIAARVLEKTPDEVSLIDANGTPTQFASALMTKEPMSLTDWMTALKSDERYGWQFTSEAKQKATSLVMDLEKAFGFRA